MAALRVWPVGNEFVGCMRAAAGVLPDVLARPYPEGNSAGVQEECCDVRDEFGYGFALRERCCGAGDERYGEQREDIAPEAVEDCASLSHVPVPLR